MICFYINEHLYQLTATSQCVIIRLLTLYRLIINDKSSLQLQNAHMDLTGQTGTVGVQTQSQPCCAPGRLHSGHHRHTHMLWSVVGPQLAVLLSQPLDLLHQRLVHGEFLHQTVDLVQLDVKLSDHLHLEVDDVSVTGVSAVLHGVMDHVLDEVDLQGGERSSR